MQVSIFLFIFLNSMRMCVHGRWKVYVSVSATVAHIGDGPTSSCREREREIDVIFIKHSHKHGSCLFWTTIKMKVILINT